MEKARIYVVIDPEIKQKFLASIEGKEPHMNMSSKIKEWINNYIKEGKQC
mgnify:CR=1 FL=1